MSSRGRQGTNQGRERRKAKGGRVKRFGRRRAPPQILINVSRDTRTQKGEIEKRRGGVSFLVKGMTALAGGGGGRKRGK